MLGLLAAAVLTASPENPDAAPLAPTLEDRTPLFHPQSPAAPVTTPSHGSIEQDAAEPPTPGGRFGIVGLLGATVDIGIRTRAIDPLSPAVTGPTPVGFGGIAGIGLRFGLFERTMERQWMPAVAVLTGTGFGPDGFSPFLEARVEYLSVTGGGPLQPNFTLYGNSGLALSRFGIYGAPTGVRPRVGFGVGWNWWPKGSGAGGSWNHMGGMGNLGHPGALAVALGIAAMVFAGRVEVQYTARPLAGPGEDFVSVVLGVGG